MNYWSLKLKVYEEVFSIRKQFGLLKNKERDLVNFDIDTPFSKEDEFLNWRNTLWNFALHRSLDIWKELSLNKLESSLGELSEHSKRSLRGKLGASKKEYVHKTEDGTWRQVKFKKTTLDKAFDPFSAHAIQLCKKRAWKRKTIPPTTPKKTWGETY